MGAPVIVNLLKQLWKYKFKEKIYGVDIKHKF